MTHPHRLTLPNGVRVVLTPTSDTAAVTVLVLYEVGSRYESGTLSGASHFIEHMMFKGTERRPSTLKISRDLDAVGADYNAFTSKDHTGYYVKLQADKLSLAIDMLEDMVYHSLYRPADLDAERQVIVEEIKMYNDNPMMSVEELMEAELFRGSPLARHIGGTEKSMAGIGRKALLDYRQAYYHPSRTVVSVAGRLDETEVMDLLTKKFGSRPAGPKPRPFRPFDPSKAGYRAPRVHLRQKETEQIQMAMGFPSYPLTDRRQASLSVLNIILGGSMSSRLFTEVREKRGLAYSVRAGANPFQDTGYTSIQAGLTKDRLDEGVRVIIAELKKLKTKDVTDGELVRAKDFAKGKTVLALEESSQLADFYGRQELLTGRVETAEEKFKRIYAVTAADVRRTANDLLKPTRMSLAFIGPMTDPKPFVGLAGGL